MSTDFYLNVPKNRFMFLNHKLQVSSKNKSVQGLVQGLLLQLLEETEL